MLVLVNPREIPIKVPAGWSDAAAAELRGNPWLDLVVKALAPKGSDLEFPNREAVEAFAQENPQADFQTILTDGGECPEREAWFFVRRKGQQDFDQPWPVGERIGELQWLLKCRDAA